MASYVYDLMLNGDEGDEWFTTEESVWVSRYGRRLLIGDERGFVDISRYSTVEEAEDEFARLLVNYGREEDQ